MQNAFSDLPTLCLSYILCCNEYDRSILQVLSLSQTTVGQLTIGHVVNLASNDVHRFHEVRKSFLSSFSFISDLFSGIRTLSLCVVGSSSTYRHHSNLVQRNRMDSINSNFLSSHTSTSTSQLSKIVLHFKVCDLAIFVKL